MTTRTVPIIKLRMLRGACKGQREIFKAEWPDGAEATLENVLRAVELGLDLDWGTKLLTPAALAEYNQQVVALRAEYDRQVVPLQAEYDRQWALIWAEYIRQEAPLRAEYQRQRGTLWAEHKRQVALLWAEYQRQIAPFWLAAFLASHGGVE